MDIDNLKGIYEHYKGGLYKLLHEAVNEQTGEEMIVYRKIHGKKVWIRDKSNFFMNVMIDGEAKPRFRYFGDKLKP